MERETAWWSHSFRGSPNFIPPVAWCHGRARVTAPGHSCSDAAMFAEDRFTIKERVGRGAMGEVYRATDHATGEEVAIKFLRTGLPDDAQERFHREARLHARVSSPHVVRHVAHGSMADGRTFLALEWLEGLDLLRAMRTRRFSLTESLDLVRQAALGVAALHDVGIIHRDLKPANLFLEEQADGQIFVRVIDLGIARADEEPALTAIGMVIGTPSYMAPEQIARAASVGPSSDVYALGVVLFELLAGRQPFAHDNPMTVLARIALDEPPRLSSLVPNVPLEIDELVANAMARDLGVRTPSALALAEALAAVLDTYTEAPIELSRRDFIAMPEEDTHIGMPTEAANDIERRVVTTIFAELANAAEFEARYARVAEFVESAGGAVHRLLDVAFVGVFGHSETTGGEAVRAATVAAAVLPALGRDALVAIATARVTTGEAVLSGDAIDDGVLLLDALRRNGARGTIAVDESTERLLENEFDVVDAHGLRVLARRRDAYEPRGTLIGEVRAFVGRDREFAALDQAYDEVVTTRRGRVVTLVGESGIGKTRLAAEFLDRLGRHVHPPFVLIGRANPMTERTTYGVIGRALRDLARIVDGDDRKTQREKLLAALGAEALFTAPSLGVKLASTGERGLDRSYSSFSGESTAELERSSTERSALRSGMTEPQLLPLLAQLAAIDDLVAPLSVSRSPLSEQLREGFVSWLEVASDTRPMVIVLESAHWADAASLDLVASGLAAHPQRPILVLALTRSLPLRALDGLPTLTLPIDKLSNSAAIELVRSVLADTPPEGGAADEDLILRIIELADGHPFFLEELLRDVYARRGAGEERLPPTIMGILQERLDRLGPMGKRIAKAASILGEVFWLDALHAILGPDAEAIEAAVDELVEGEVFVRREGPTARAAHELAFRHGLVQKAAYDLVSDGDRALMHQRAARWLEPRQLVPAFELATHFDRGEDSDAARNAYRIAAEQALLGSHIEAVSFCARRAIELGARGEERGYLRLLLAEASSWVGHLDESREESELALGELMPGSPLYFYALREAISSSSRGGKRDEAVTFSEVALSVDATGEEAHIARVEAVAIAGGQAALRGERELATRALTILRELTPPSVVLPARARGFVQQAIALGCGDDALEDAVTLQVAALDAFTECGDARRTALTSSNLARALTRLGSLDDAALYGRHAVEVANRFRLPLLEAHGIAVLALVAHCRNRPEEAVALFREALHGFERHGTPRLIETQRIRLALELIRLGSIDEARTLAELAHRDPQSITVGAARAALAAIAVAEGALDRAETLIEDAIASLVASREGEGFVVVAHCIRIDVLSARGSARLGAAIREAQALVDARAATIRNPATRRAFLENVPEHAYLVSLVAPP